MLSPEGRTERARAAALIRHSQTDSTNSTAAARAALIDQYRHRVDPDGVLDPTERDVRARRLMGADLARHRLRAAEKREHTKGQEATNQVASELLAVRDAL